MKYKQPTTYLMVLNYTNKDTYYNNESILACRYLVVIEYKCVLLHRLLIVALRALCSPMTHYCLVHYCVVIVENTSTTTEEKEFSFSYTNNSYVHYGRFAQCYSLLWTCMNAIYKIKCPLNP